MAALKSFLGSMASKVAGKLNGGEQEHTPPSVQDGNAPVPGAPESPYGPNNEDLKKKRPDIVTALQSLVLERKLTDMRSQQRKIRRIRLAREFWQNNQEGSPGAEAVVSGSQVMALAAGDDSQDATGPRYRFITNFYTAYGLTFCSIMSQDVPHPEFYPASRERQEDITFAKAVEDVVDEIERNNKPKSLLTAIANRFWTDGIIGGYVRYVVDGKRFGYKTMPIQGTRQSVLDGEPVTVPSEDGEEKIPNGQEVITIVGGLELALPNYADDFQDCGYLIWSTEPPITRLKSLYPKAAEGIDADSELTAEQAYERIARLSIKQNAPFLAPGDVLSILATFTRTWLREWEFEGIKTESLRKEIQELFPDGCYIAFAGLEYCESRNESMDDRWRIKHAIPGDGNARPAAGDSLIPLNDRYNVLSNLQTETYEYGIPPIYADPKVLDFDALASQTAEPAVHYPAQARPGMSLADGFYSPDPAKEPVTLAQTMADLMGPTAQFLSGIVPTVAGGEMEGGAGETASGYAMARDQAMGRLGLIWRAVQEVYFELMFLGVKCFKENRPEDVEVPFIGESNSERAKWIRKGDLEGNIMLKGEPDADQPRLKGEQRAMLDKLFAMADNPLVQECLTMPSNIGWIKDVLGTPELEIPGDDARIKQMRETQMLLSTPPFQAPPQQAMQPGPDGQPIAGIVQPPAQPTVQVGKYDYHEVELAEGTRYLSSDDGQQQMRENPAGIQNLILHLDMHAAAIDQKNKANQPKVPPKPPSMSIQVDKLPPNAEAQALAMDGIQMDPMELQAHQDQQRQDKADELKARMASKKPQESMNG